VPLLCENPYLITIIVKYFTLRKGQLVEEALIFVTASGEHNIIITFIKRMLFLILLRG
jgi:hypothetical protein